MPNFTDDEKYLLQLISTCSALLSFVGALFISLMYILNRQLRGFGFRLIFYLALSDLVCGIGHLLNFRFLSIPSRNLCIAQAFIINFSGLSSILWTTVIAFTVYKIVRGPIFYYRRYEKYFLLYGYGLPLLLSLIPFITEDYGEEGAGWCWIELYEEDNSEKQSLFMVFLEFYGPLWLAFFFNLFAYWRSSRVIKNLVSECHELKLIGKLLYYPIVLIFCWSIGTFHRIYIFFAEPLLWIAILHSLLGCIQGLLNAILYGMNEKVRRTLRQKLQNCCGLLDNDNSARQSRVIAPSNTLLSPPSHDGLAGYIQNKSMESFYEVEQKEKILKNSHSEVLMTQQPLDLSNEKK